MSSTSALDVIIQAVSPELRGSGGAAAAKAGAIVDANTPRPAATPSPTRFVVEEIIAMLPLIFDCSGLRMALERVAVGFAGTDANHLLERRDEDLSVSDLTGLGFGGNRLDHRVRHFAFDGDFDFQFGQKADGVFRAAIDFRMSLLPPVAFDFRHRHALNAQRR